MSCSVYAGMTDDQKRVALSKAQQALIDLNTGSKGVAFTYTQGDGAKSVTYSAADRSALNQMIAQLQQELGIVKRARRPIRFNFV